MKFKNTKFDFFNLTPMVILLWCLFSFFFRPIIPVASGFGWDGIFYGKVAMNFQNMIGSIDSYHANRIFPGILIHYFFSFLKFPLHIESVLFGYKVYNIIILVLSSVIWVSISRHLALNQAAKWIGFFALFINYPLLNLHFYYPPLTDGTAFFFGMVMLYSYLKRNDILLLFVSMLSFFTWPAGVIIGLLLFIYSKTHKIIWHDKNKRTPLFLILILLSPFLAFIGANFIGEIKNIIVQSGMDGKIFKKFNEPGIYSPVNFTYLLNSILNATYIVFVFWVILKNFEFRHFIKYNFQRKTFIKIFVSIIILIVLILFKRIIYAPDLATLTPLNYFRFYFVGSNVRFPFQFIIYQVTYWGPIILLLILF